LDNSLAPFRIGSVPYLNAVPLTRGLEDQIVLAPPSELAELLRSDKLDAALVSVSAVLFDGAYDVLDDIAIASLGEVKSVLLGHRRPLSQAEVIYCDTASLTSVRLLQVLLAERGLHPVFKPLTSYDAPEKMPDFVLLIGDPALDFLFHASEHQIWDLGAAWYELTGLPFVYAVWALRRRTDNQRLRALLREARQFGLETLDHIVSSRTEYTYQFRKDYLGWHIHYHLGSEEKRGLATFVHLLRKHIPAMVHDPVYVR
jgi:chorismate dehydratase